MSPHGPRSFDSTILDEYAQEPFFLGTPFTDGDRAIIRAVLDLVPTISTLLGRHCEIVVHSLEDPEHAVVRAVNADLSVRAPGDPISREGLATLREKLEDSSAYFCRGSDGEHLKSGISPIVNPQGRCIGSFSIALNLDAPLSGLLAALSPQCEQGREEMRIWGTGPMKPEEIIEETCRRIDARRDIPARSRAKAIIGELFAQGVFDRYRNAVSLVSGCTGISTVTVYWHLRELKKEAGRTETAGADADGRA